jgi:hypothetical protein
MLSPKETDTTVIMLMCHRLVASFFTGFEWTGPCQAARSPPRRSWTHSMPPQQTKSILASEPPAPRTMKACNFETCIMSIADGVLQAVACGRDADAAANLPPSRVQGVAAGQSAHRRAAGDLAPLFGSL